AGVVRQLWSHLARRWPQDAERATPTGVKCRFQRRMGMTEGIGEGVADQEPQFELGGGGESLLVVDDDPFIARLLEIELKAAGYDVRVASDGQLALMAAQERCPALILA